MILQAGCFLISICWKRKQALLLSLLGPPSSHRNVSLNISENQVGPAESGLRPASALLGVGSQAVAGLVPFCHLAWPFLYASAPLAFQPGEVPRGRREEGARKAGRPTSEPPLPAQHPTRAAGPPASLMAQGSPPRSRPQRGGAVYRLPAFLLGRPDRSLMPGARASHSLPWKQSTYLLSSLDKCITETALGQARGPRAELCSGRPLTLPIPVWPGAGKEACRACCTQVPVVS